MKFFFFLFGLILILAGWIGDNSSNIKWLQKIISPETVNAINALDIMENNKKIGLLSKASGFEELLEFWPNMDNPSSVKIIKRTIPYISMGDKIEYNFDLIAIDENGNQIEKVWSEVSARKLFLQKQEKSFFRIKFIVFVVGFIITILSGVSEFRQEKKYG
jgi:hypothetical protein